MTVLTDFQTNSTLQLVVSLEDEVNGTGKNNVVEQGITVIILDENDNPPEFQNVSVTQSFYYFEDKEL